MIPRSSRASPLGGVSRSKAPIKQSLSPTSPVIPMGHTEGYRSADSHRARLDHPSVVQAAQKHAENTFALPWIKGEFQGLKQAIMQLLSIPEQIAETIAGAFNDTKSYLTRLYYSACQKHRGLSITTFLSYCKSLVHIAETQGLSPALLLTSYQFFLFDFVLLELFISDVQKFEKFATQEITKVVQKIRSL